ncbi:DUF5008 domain-containing protein [Pedobacter frigiditerrae]|uniref:DUF5008 domain-containing protein n=1 Tax=Pedobacter frigiditerrae TaxID=2530452 RepID=A0A4R0MXG4_9SPHI|nr:DUF5008 domain-containing protein [Pedobacter frigiditerrae]TCC91968.1 DUF5008 domain-containing protein [Pedobacter frigiditerrae]
MFKNKIYQFKLIGLALLAMTVIVACEKEKGIAEDPYAGGKGALPISILSKNTSPDIITAGASLTIKVSGLTTAKYKDTDFKIFVNEIEAPLTARTDSTITFNVPLDASTGSMWVELNGQLFFGPVVKVGGKVSVDNAFKIVNGAGTVTGTGSTDVYAMQVLATGNFLLGGAFSNFELKGTEKLPNGGIVQIDGDGAYSTANSFNFGKGAVGGNQSIYAINLINTGTHAGKFIVAGSFTAYNSTRGNRQTLNNITRLNANGTLDSVIVDVINPKPEEIYKNRDTISSFNAGVDGTIKKTFVFGEQVYMIGNFQNFKRMYVPNSSYDAKVYDVTKMRQMVRVNNDGSMDSTFHYNKVTKQSAIGANGGITDAIMQADGKLILVGNFTTFNGTTANHIVRLNLNGSVDNTFNVGTGSDGDIYSIRHNATTNKIVVAGLFKTFNGKTVDGLNLLNADGSNVNTFTSLGFSGGLASFAGQLANGKIIVAGSFNKYGSYMRQGFTILEANGSLAIGYNNIGGFQGRVYDMYEKSIANGTSVILVGNIARFNSIIPHNVLRLIIAN